MPDTTNWSLEIAAGRQPRCFGCCVGKLILGQPLRGRKIGDCVGKDGSDKGAAVGAGNFSKQSGMPGWP